MTTLDDVRDAVQGADRITNEYLRARGWRHTSSNPASLWLWEKRMADGRIVLVDRDTAMTFQRMDLNAEENS